VLHLTALISSSASSQPTDPKQKSGCSFLAASSRAERQSLMMRVVPRWHKENATGIPFWWWVTFQIGSASKLSQPALLQESGIILLHVGAFREAWQSPETCLLIIVLVCLCMRKDKHAPSIFNGTCGSSRLPTTAECEGKHSPYCCNHKDRISTG
jgi:hypothetical protein